MLEACTADTFAPHVGSEFAVRAVDQEGIEHVVPLVLERSEPLGEPTEDARAPFTLEFRGPGDRILHQATLPFSHAVLGDFALFLVPSAQDASGMAYVATFN
ncbi:hypothetical protein [Paraconexibacter sp.]|uniref:DUF6916 family protein n=1 Tax=Paraconexibacter sp. TaxID=2949640 RepID=UPI003566B9DB